MRFGKGPGVAKDEAEVARYYKLAADQNHVSAQKRYAVSVVNVRDVSTNEAETARYFELAADQNELRNAMPSVLRPGEAL
jgi:TPR repeat protein